MEIDRLVESLMKRRGIEGEEAVRAFLQPEYDAHTHDPFLFNGMDMAVDRLLHAFESDERIAVYADFDCDGIPGASILFDTFKKIGYENFEVYLPHRDREGYGFHIDAIDTLASRGVKLIITVDVGTTAVGPVAHAKSLGIDVIVTDHHEIVGQLPDAFAILNPKIAPYPFPHLCGSGVAYKFACALLLKGKQLGIDRFASIPNGWEKWLLDLVAIATVADMVPLVGENRVLTFWGLQVLRKSQRPGISALCTLLRIKKPELTETDIGFSIAPRINAASRMDEPDLALHLLTTKDRAQADQLALQLEGLNTKRKGAAGAIVRAAKKHARTRFTDDEKVIVLGDPEWKPALLGLAANSVLADRSGVVCLWGRDANGKLKGSCRSDGEISLAELFTSARELFDECGGHTASGGFSVSHERVHDLHERLAQFAANLPRNETQEQDPASAEHEKMYLPDISWTLYNEVSRLAPFGMGNEKPTFLIEHARVATVRTFGKDNAHVEMTLSDEKGFTIRAFEFFKRPDDFTHAPEEGGMARIVATLERDAFRGPAKLALRIVDVLPPDSTSGTGISAAS